MFSKKIPTLLGLILFIIILGGFIFAFEKGIRLPAKAAPEVAPQSVEITNVTDTSFTASWITNDEATGAIEVSGRTVFGEKGSEKSTTHSVTFRGAKPDTSYAFNIFSNGKSYSQNSVETGPAISGSVNLEPAYGVVPAGALVYLTIEGGQKLSTVAGSSGTWLIPLTLVRDERLASFLIPQERMTEYVVVRLGREESTAITDTLNDAPVPDMQLGKTYDFRRQQAKAIDALFSLIKPEEGSALPTSFPLIQGTGIPGQQVAITLGITSPIGGSAVVGLDGIWRFTPPNQLAPGKQSITATSTNGEGKAIALTHSFEVLKSGTQVLGDATPSATLTPTPTSTASAQPPPESGSTLPTILLLIIGVGLIASGGLWYLTSPVKVP